MKKYLLSFGVISFIALPLALAISCSNSEEAKVITIKINAKDNTKDLTLKYTIDEPIMLDDLLAQHNEFILSPEDTQFGRYIVSANGVTPQYPNTFWQIMVNGAPSEVGASMIELTKNTNIEIVETAIGEDQDWSTSLSSQHNITEDGMYLVKNDYDGTFWNGNKTIGSVVTDEIVKVPFDQSTSNFNHDVVEIGDGDSIYMLYDQDDEDGMNLMNFENTVFFDDTSVMNNESITNYNKAAGNRQITKGFPINLTTFNPEGKINVWFGSQSNHVTGSSFDESLEGVRNYYAEQPEVFQAIEQYYQSGASRVFFPVYQETPYFTFEKLNYAVKIDVHYDGEAPITGAKFVMTNDQTNYQFSSPFSIGDKSEWDHYENSNSYTFLARKNQYITP